MPKRALIPLKDFLPDAGALANPGLRRAWGVVPFYGNYIVSPGLNIIGSDLGTEPLGFHLHEATDADLKAELYGYYGDATKLWELDIAAVSKADRTRTVGGAYAFGAIVPYWDFHTFGELVIATNYADEVQYQTAPGANFADMITSTFKPQARFVFSIGENLFLANCNLPSTYDGLSAGANPNLLVWSMNNNVRAYGSANADPQLIGAGFQPLNNDLGPITGGIGGDFGIVFQRKGHVRIDGPPYTTKGHPEGGCLQPDSIVRVGDDIYFWGHRGPSVLRGGNPPVQVLTERTAARALLDSTTGISAIAATVSFEGDRAARVHVALDQQNGLIRWSYLPNGDIRFSDTVSPFWAGAFFDYNYIEDRFGVTPIRTGDDEVTRVFGLDTASLGDGDPWLPVIGIYGIRERVFGLGSKEYHLFNFNNNGNIPKPKQDVVFQNGLVLINEEKTTRIRRVRPIYRKVPATAAIAVSVTITSANAPADDEVSYGPFAKLDAMGWVVTPETVFADLHSVQLTIDTDAVGQGTGDNITEIEAIEIEYDEGGAYGA